MNFVYKIELTTKATKIYLRLPREIKQAVDLKLEQISRNPYAKHNNVKPLKNMKKCYRLRIASWRVVYEVVNKTLTICVVNVGQRKEIYRGT